MAQDYNDLFGSPKKVIHITIDVQEGSTGNSLIPPKEDRIK